MSQLSLISQFRSGGVSVGQPEVPCIGERLLGYVAAVNFNSVAATTIFTVPAGVSCYVTKIIVDGYSTGTPTTASVSFGASGTPTDWSATATDANATTSSAKVFSPTASLMVKYAAATAFVANVTIAQGTAVTANVAVFGYYL
jgi:hypothetical protein